MYSIKDNKCPYCGKKLTHKPSHKDMCKRCGNTYRVMPKLAGYPGKVIVTEAEAKVLRDREKARKYRARFPLGKFQHSVVLFWREINDLFSDWLRKYPQPMKPNNELLRVRNKINKLFRVAIGRYVQELKHGKSINFQNFIKLTTESKSLPIMGRDKYKIACEICGETRAHNFAHIIPSTEGGGEEIDNMLHLCANHHKMFDDNTLTQKDWKKINFKKKSSASQEYAKQIILPRLKVNWELNKLNELKKKKKITEKVFEKKRDKLLYK